MEINLDSQKDPRFWVLRLKPRISFFPRQFMQPRNAVALLQRGAFSFYIFYIKIKRHKNIEFNLRQMENRFKYQKLVLELGISVVIYRL